MEPRVDAERPPKSSQAGQWHLWFALSPHGDGKRDSVD
jgi:hypothetical protein